MYVFPNRVTIDSNEIQSHLAIRQLFLTFPMLLKYKTDFPLIIIYHNFSQLRSVRSFVTMFLWWFPITYILWTVQELHSCGLVRCKQHGDPSIVLTERERKDHFEQRTKRQFFCRPQEKVQSWLETFGSCTKLPALDSFNMVFQW